MPGKPMAGLRICDLSCWWSGPYSTAFMGGLGAEVIKVESVQRVDGQRIGPAIFDRWWEANVIWNSANLNKYDITLDLNSPRGNEILKELIRVSDVLIENFPARVMEGFKLTYPVIKEIKPDIIMMSMPAYGGTGPWRNYAGWGHTFEQASGLAFLTGYQDGPPEPLGGAADPISGMHAAFAMMAALDYRRRTGKGQFIDISQTEGLSCLLGQPVIDYPMNKRVWGRLGNRDRFMAPHGVYRCKGDDMWVAVTVSTDDEWKAFCRAIGSQQLAADDRFTTLINRWRNQDELDKMIEAWTVTKDYYEAMDILQKAGVPAGAVNAADRMKEEPQFKDRGFFQDLTREVTGTQPFPNWPIRMPETPVEMRPAPLLGEHNEMVLGALLGVPAAEFEELKSRKIIGNEPLG